MSVRAPAHLVVEALLQRFLPLARRRIDAIQAQNGDYWRSIDPAYEQVMESLAVVAKHAPAPLLEALWQWREREYPKTADYSAVHRKLAVECIFTTAAVRLLRPCPANGLTEKLWAGLEDFAFDWLINAERYNHAEYPALLELRTVLLDLVAQLLGQLSGKRFADVTDRFFDELNARRADGQGQRAETLNIVHGFRYLQLGVETSAELNQATSYLLKANPLQRVPAKKKTEYHHAFCNMMTNILTPLADRGQWPPRVADEALRLWHDALLRLRNLLSQWIDKHSKHILVGYPLVTVLLCLGDPQYFSTQFAPYLEALYRLLKDKVHRSMALDCIHRLVRFYLVTYASLQPRKVTWTYLQSVTSHLLTSLKKGSFTQEVQHDRLVDLCVTVADSHLEFAINNMFLELLRPESPGDAKVIGLRALLYTIQRIYSARQAGSHQGGGTLAVEDLRIGVIPIDSQGIGSFVVKIRAALGAIIQASHASFGQALLISAKPIHDPATKERAQGWTVFRWALKCVPYFLPDQWKDNKMADVMPVYAICIDTSVREEAVQVLFRTVRDLPSSRFAVMRGMANFILRISDEYPLLIHSSLSRLVQLLGAWRGCLAEEMAIEQDSTSQEINSFDPSGMDAVGLIFLGSAEVNIRRAALELLVMVRALHQELALYQSSEEVLSTYVIDVIEEAGEDIIQQCYWEVGRWFDRRREADPAPADVSLVSVLEGMERARWGRCLCELAKHTAQLCPASVQGARLEVVARLATITPVDSGGRPTTYSGSVLDDSKVEQWHLYCMFACACPPEESLDGGVQSVRDLMRLVLPSLRSTNDTQQAAAVLALGHAHPDLYNVMLGELTAYVEDVAAAAADRPKWKSHKGRREDLRVFGVHIYRMVAESIWPGMLADKPHLRLTFSRFIDDQLKALSNPNSSENFIDLQPVRYSLAVAVNTLAVDLALYAPERFEPRLRKRLFELFASWADEGSVWQSGEHGAGELRRELERLRSMQTIKVRESMERMAVDKELTDQIDSIHLAALHAMKALLYGPCFDDQARKMSGRVIGWINSLFMGTSERVPPSYSPADLRTPSPHHRTGSLGSFPPFGSHSAARARLSAAARMSLAKAALQNLLQTNTELFVAAIDQCYSSEASIADGYFSVLAEVYMQQAVKEVDVPVLLSLILYKVVDPSKQIRDDALQMLETLSSREWPQGTSSRVGRYGAAVVGSLPDSYQQFQYELSTKLAKEHPELSELLCVEMMQRQLDAVDIIAQHQVLTCMAPWIENLNFVSLWETGWSERLLKSLYYVTWRHGDQFPDEVEKLWSVVAQRWRNIIPVLDFLISKGIEDMDSQGAGEISGAFATYFAVAKRISLYLARVSPQQTIDHLVYELSQRMFEEDLETTRTNRTDFQIESLGQTQILEFSAQPPLAVAFHEPSPAQVVALPIHLSPLITTRGSFDSSSRPPHLHSSHGSFGGGNVRLGVSNGSFRSANGSLAGRSYHSHHVSRDSGDFYLDTPTSSVDDLRVTTPLGSHVGGGPSGGPGEVHHALTRADLALVLLAEIAYENDEDFRGHLPLLLHVTFVAMDSAEDLVLEHCQQLLVNLLYSLAGRHLELYSAGPTEEGPNEQKQKVVNLIKYLQSKKGSLMWENEDMTVANLDLQSSALLGSMVTSVVEAIFFQGDLRESWGEEALKWAMECASRHLACRSHQIYRYLRPASTSDTCVSLLRCLHKCFQNPTLDILGFVMEILLTLQVMVEVMEPEKVILYPQMFWGCVALLHTDFIHVYTQALELLARVMDRLSFQDRTAETVLLSSMPRPPPNAPPDFPPFEGLQPLVLKGLLSPVSHGTALAVLSRITLLTCDRIFGVGETRLLMHIMGLLPWLCLQHFPLPLRWEGRNPPPGTPPSLPKECLEVPEPRSTASRLAQACGAQQLTELSSAFLFYTHGSVQSAEEFLQHVAPPLCQAFFPQLAGVAFSHLLAMLEKGPPGYARVILLVLHALHKYSGPDAALGSSIYTAVSEFLEGPLCREALAVLEAVLQNTNSRTDTQQQEPPQHNRNQSRCASTGSASELLLPNREVALQHTVTALGLVLETYGPGNKRDHRRLVPFVTIDSAQGTTAGSKKQTQAWAT